MPLLIELKIIRKGKAKEGREASERCKRRRKTEEKGKESKKGGW